MPPSIALLDAVDARIKAQRQGLAEPAVAPTPAINLPMTPPAPSPEPAPYAVRGANSDIFERIAANAKARREAAGRALREKLDAYEQPLPAYSVRGAEAKPAADSVAQWQDQVGSMRQPEWWTEGLIGGAALVGDWLVNLPNTDGCAAMAERDPIYRELRRAALFHKLKSSLNDAAAYAKAGKEDMALGRLQHAEIYKRQIEALDGGRWNQSY